MIANVASGVMMYAVHFSPKAKIFPPAEYGTFGVMLAVAMFVPNHAVANGVCATDGQGAGDEPRPTNWRA